MVKIVNNGSTDITVVEVVKKTTLTPGDEVEIDDATTIIELE